MEILARPFVRGWNWIETVGGFPGQMFAVVVIVMLVIGFLTWFSNKR